MNILKHIYCNAMHYMEQFRSKVNIKKNCSIGELKNSLEKISFQNKEYLLSHNILKNKENIFKKKPKG